MPRSVDHEARRRDIAAAAWNLIEDSGVQGVTLRGVAERMNGSTTLVTHYFSEKDAVIAFANAQIFSKWRAELNELTADAPPEEALRALLQWALPLSNEGVAFARAMISITDYAFTNPTVSAELYKWSDWYWRKVDDIVASWIRSHEAESRSSVNDVTDIIRALLNGINLSALQGQRGWSADRQVELLMTTLGSLTGLPTTTNHTTTRSRSKAGKR